MSVSARRNFPSVFNIKEILRYSFIMTEEEDERTHTNIKRNLTSAFIPLKEMDRNRGGGDQAH